MLVAGEVKGELARIVPARTCCRRAELAGLLSTDRTVGQVSTFDYGTARIAVQLAASLGLPISGPHPAVRSGRPAGDRSPRRHHLVVGLDRASIGDWTWDAAPACDRRAYLRGALERLPDVWGPPTAYPLPTRYWRRQMAGLPLEPPISGTGSTLLGRWIVVICCTIQALLPTLTVWHI